jgi:hypothetical protein
MKSELDQAIEQAFDQAFDQAVQAIVDGQINAGARLRALRLTFSVLSLPCTHAAFVLAR